MEGIAQRLRHMTPQLLPILLAGILGVLAIWRSRVADRQQQEFIERQRAFITRVTHEFKTPLAGVQLMADPQMLPTSPIRQSSSSYGYSPKRIDLILELMKSSRLLKRLSFAALHVSTQR